MGLVQGLSEKKIQTVSFYMALNLGLRINGSGCPCCAAVIGELRLEQNPETKKE
jgi:hypothetical protein